MQTILLVDDDRLVRLALEETLKREGYLVLTAANGEEAIAHLKSQEVAVILCDQRLPGLSGIDVLKQAQEIQPRAIRLLLTGYGDLETVLQAINVGKVSQFLLKPWDERLLMQTVATACEQYRLVKENLDLHSLIVQQHIALSKTHETLKQDLLLGARIHETLLLGKVPHAIPGFSIEAMTIPSKEIDGDFFEFYRPSPETLDLVIGDVMGKGLPAALVATALKTQLMRFAVPFTHEKKCGLMGVWEEDLLQPHEILSHVHREIVPSLVQLDYFSSIFYGRFRLSKRTFSYVDCGSTKPIHYRAPQKKAYPLQGKNCPLGTLEQEIYTQEEVPYAPGDFLIFYSDGVTETKSPQNELYGFERLIALAEKNPDKDAAELLLLIKASVVAFAEKEHFEDDLTLLVIKIEDTPLPQQKLKASFHADLSQLGAVRAFIDRHCHNSPGDSKMLSLQLQLAINEAFCNIAKYGYPEEKERPVLIDLEMGSEGITALVSDRGITFDPAALLEPSLAGDLSNGFGWYIIRRIADQINYVQKESESGWNHLRLFKRYLWEGSTMQFSQSTQDQVLIITPEASSLDANVATAFKDKVTDLLAHNEQKCVVFDLHELQFIDSSGLGTFLSVLRTMHRKGGELKLACLNKPVRTMFELVSMHKVFEIYNTTDEAVKSFNVTG